MINYFNDVYKNPLFLIWIIFFSISPIYWLPLSSIEFLDNAKQFIFFIAIFYSLFVIFNYKIYLFPSKNKGIFFFIFFIIALLPGLSNTNPYEFSEFHDQFLLNEEKPNISFAIMQFLPSILVLLIFYNLNFKFENLLKICSISAFIFSFFIFVHGLSFVFDNLNFQNPYVNSEAVYLQETGFSSYKTNWSNATAVMFPLIILFYKKTIKQIYIVWFFVIAVFFVQVLSGGRAGIISSFCVLFIYLCFYSNFKEIILSSLLLFILVYLYSDYTYLYQIFKFKDLEIHNYGDFQGFRIQQFIISAQIISNNFFGGFGFDKNFDQMYKYFREFYDFKAFIPDYELSTIKKVHNEFIRLYLEAGVLLFICILIFLINLTYKSYKLIFYYKKNNDQNLIMSLVLFSIVITSFFGYYTMFGSFNNEPIFWATSGILLSNYDNIFIRTS